MKLLIGTFTAPTSAAPCACGKGLLRIEVDPSARRWRHISPPCQIEDPTYLAWIPKQRRLLAVTRKTNHTEALALLRIPVTPTQPELIDEISTHGRASCHICVLPGGENAAVTSYLDACLDVYRINAGMKLFQQSYFRYTGNSIHPSRQQHAHAHQACVSPDGRYLYVCDLGSDCIWKHSIHGDLVTAATEKIGVPAGEGPRHMVFDTCRPRAYVIAELTGNLLVFDFLAEQDGTLRFRGGLSGLPEDYTGAPSGAAIVRHPTGKTLLVSQRGHNSIAFFEMDDRHAALGIRRRLNMPCGGREPRDCMLDDSGRWLFVANQNSNNITVFEVDPEKGLPLDTPPFSMAVETPVCIVQETD